MPLKQLAIEDRFYLIFLLNKGGRHARNNHHLQIFRSGGRLAQCHGKLVSAINADSDVAGKFTYQVSVADDGETRIHWGRWDSQETLKTVQSRDYFSVFAAKVKAFAGGQPQNTGADVQFKTQGW